VCDLSTQYKSAAATSTTDRQVPPSPHHITMVNREGAVWTNRWMKCAAVFGHHHM
jgi:hypothetical protein